jgi:stage II sporulation protein AB (anti-sigma F factor)
MGFTFMEAFSDEITVKSEPGKGTTVKLIKTMGKGEECGEDL